MGLDMYLNARRHLWYNEDSLKSQVAEAFPELGDVDVKEVVVEAGYWRKANAIHKWFVDNVQNGVDDCGTYEVSTEKIQELLALVVEVLQNRKKSSDLLPTQSGFFFGQTEYDQWYFQDLELTKKILENLLEPKWERWYFEYHSSW